MKPYAQHEYLTDVQRETWSPLTYITGVSSGVEDLAGCPAFCEVLQDVLLTLEISVTELVM